LSVIRFPGSDALDDLVPEPAPPELSDEEALEEAREEIRADARVFLELPEDAPLEAIQAEFAASYWLFWTYFGQDWRKDRKGREIASAPFHRKLADDITALVHGETEEDTIARAYPRECAKSVVGTAWAAIWAAANQLRRFAVITSDTSDQARGILSDIRTEIDTNERLQAVYPELGVYLEKPRVNFLVLGTECVIAAAGSGKAIRGARWRRFRPDLIFGDDLENDQEVHNPKRRRKKAAWWNKVVRKLGRAAVYIIVGTILHAESFLKHQVESDADIHRALVSYPEELDGLWREWEAIYHDRSLPDRKAAARAFYVANRTRMDRGAVVLWPEQFTLYGLMTERAEDLGSFLSERQNDPFDPAGSYFPTINYRSREELPAEDDVLATGIFWDPSRGTTISDTSAVVEIDFIRDGRRVVRWVLAEALPPDQVQSAIIARHVLRRIHFAGVEKVALSSYDEDLQKAARAAQVTINLVAGPPKGDKDLRIKSRRGGVVSETILFSDELSAAAKEQISYYGQHPKDDVWDAIDQCLTVGEGQFEEVTAACSSLAPAKDAGRLTAEDALGREGLFDDAGGVQVPRMGEQLGFGTGGWS
jgi:hypothetical protein